MAFQTRGHRHKILFFTFLLFTVMVSCENSSGPKTSAAKSVITDIQSKEHFQQIVETSGDRLLLFEFYADWCPPCRELTPVMEEIAKKYSDILDVYKINTDKNSDLAREFRIVGIPHVAFFKNKESVMSLSGLYPKTMYLKVIGQLSSVVAEKGSDQQDGT